MATEIVMVGQFAIKEDYKTPVQSLVQNAWQKTLSQMRENGTVLEAKLAVFAQDAQKLPVWLSDDRALLDALLKMVKNR